MAQTGHLQTASEQHSVKEAVISFSLKPKLNNPLIYEKLLEEGAPLNGRYHKFEPIVVQDIKIDGRLNQTDIKGVTEKGFKFIGFEGGKTSEIIQAIPQLNQTILTFNTVNYINWSKYLKSSLSDAKAISSIDTNLLLESLGVMFVDEFYFQKHSTYIPTEIFDLNSPQLPKSVFDSDSTYYNLSNHKNADGFDYMENLSIQVFNDMEYERKVIRITGNIMSFISPVSFSHSLESEELLKYLNFGHEQNKSMLRGLLSKNALNMIGL